MKKLALSIALVAAVSVLALPVVTYAAVPAGIPTVVSKATTTAFTFAGDILDNYTALILWVLFLGAIVGLIIGMSLN